MHKKQLDSIIYQGAGFVQVPVSCSLQQHKNTENLREIYFNTKN